MINYEINFESSDELESILLEWIESYEQGEPQVPDNVFDHYKNILKHLKPTSFIFNQIGLRPKKSKEVLPYICGSLKNKTSDDIDDWLKKCSSYGGFVLSHKLDGISLITEWVDNGILKNAWLRGDGYYGENVTEKARVFLPKQLNVTDNKTLQSYSVTNKTFILTHEILLSCEPSEIGYKNKRNSVSGIMHRDDNVYLDKLYCLAHGWKNPSGNAKEDEYIRMECLKSMIDTVPFRYVSEATDVSKVAETMLKEQSQYDKDGIVVCARKTEVENAKLPEMKIAFKFNKQIAISDVKLIEWNVSRTGRIVPLVYITPVNLGGVTIGRCTAFHAKFIKEKQINVGSTIKVCRSGDVIPYIEEVLTTKEPELPEKCPCCKNKLSWDNTQTNIRCTNKDCSEVIRKKISYFFVSLGLEFFSEKMISSLNCNSIFEIYNLKEEDILKIEGWGESSAKDFVQRIRNTKSTTPENLIAALGIEGIAQTTAKNLLNHFTFEELISLTEKDITKITAIKGFADKKAMTIINGIKENKQFLQDLFQVGFKVQDKPKGPLSGLSFEITGSLSKPRKEIIQLIEKNGGQYTSISNCKYLICNEKDSTSSKMKTAREKGISIITEKELQDMIVELLR